MIINPKLESDIIESKRKKEFEREIKDEFQLSTIEPPSLQW